MNSTLQSPTSVHPVIFEEFFELGLEETVSPFITIETRSFGANLTLKASILAAVLLGASFAFSFHSYTLPLSYFTLLVVYFLAGVPSLIASIEDLLSGEVNIDILMTLAAFSSVLIGSGLEGGLLLVLFALSGAMEETVTAKAKSSLSHLHKLSPTKATVISEEGLLIERAVSEILPGTRILVKSGQIVPLDGRVIEGISSVNLVHLSGENIPVMKQREDEVPAGATNMEGVLTLEVTHTSADSTLSRIIQLVTQAQEAKPLLQRWFDKLSKAYAITIIMLSFSFALSMPFIYSISFLGIEGSIYRSLAFLIAASPCALIIAIPIAYLSAIGACAKRGILLKGGISLDALASCKIIAFDKTGTLTTGELTCEGIEPLENYSLEEQDFALSIAVAMEKNSVHPLARSILAYSNNFKITPLSLIDFKTIPGYGLEAKIAIDNNSLEVFIGNVDFIRPKLTERQFNLLLQRKSQYEKNGQTLSTLLIENRIYLFRFHDTPRSTIMETIQSLKK